MFVSTRQYASADGSACVLVYGTRAQLVTGGYERSIVDLLMSTWRARINLHKTSKNGSHEVRSASQLNYARCAVLAKTRVDWRTGLMFPSPALYFYISSTVRIA